MSLMEKSRPVPGTAPESAGTRHTGALRRWLPAAAMLALIALGYAFGVHHYVSLASLAENREALRIFVGDHLFLAVLLYMAVYVAVVSLSLPGGAVMSIAGGLLFGWMLSVPITIVSALIGSVIVFQIVKTSFGAALADRAGPLVQRLSRGFSENAFSLLLFLRLAPVFPFCAVNAVSGLCRVPLRSFVAATIIGIIPASIAFALIGSGLDAVIDVQMASYRSCVAAQGAANCSFTLEPSALLTRELVLGLAALGLVALIPLGVKLWKQRRA